jgi:hypothetical protein
MILSIRVFSILYLLSTNPTHCKISIKISVSENISPASIVHQINAHAAIQAAFHKTGITLQRAAGQTSIAT